MNKREESSQNFMRQKAKSFVFKISKVNLEILYVEENFSKKFSNFIFQQGKSPSSISPL